MGEKDRQEMELVDQLVFAYQAGDMASGEELMKRFGCHPTERSLQSYVGKYYKFIRTVPYRMFNSRENRVFISCFMKDPDVRARLIRKNTSSEIRTKVVEHWPKMVDQWRCIPDEELWFELRYLFLRQAKRYKHKYKNIFFTGYLSNSYGYAVAQFLRKRLKTYDIYARKRPMIVYAEDVHEDDEAEITVSDKVFTHLPFLIEDEELGNAWVRGFDCDDRFRRLSQLQRLILKMYYEDDLTDQKIADTMNLHINTIHKYRKKACQIVQETHEYLLQGGEL